MVEHYFRKVGVVGSTPILGFVDTDQKYKSLIDDIKSYPKIALAFSGGVDSTFLLKVLVDNLGKKDVLPCICVSQLLSEPKLRQARTHCSEIGIELLELNFDVLSDPDFVANPKNKCYICKKKIYSLIRQTAKSKGFEVIASGTNLDDLSDYRPGNKAADEFHIINPLAKERLTKDDIRKLSFRLGLKTANAPSSPCYASRIPYGQPITAEKLDQIAQAEEFLHSLNFTDLRVRHYGTMAKIEIPQADFEKMISEPLKTIVIKKFQSIGFNDTALDLKGFRSGALNETLDEK